MHKLAQSVLAYIREHELLAAGDRLGIAVSGGADSVALLRLMLELRQELGLVLSVVHLNHKLRGAESDGDEEFVRHLAEAHVLELISERCDVTAQATRRKVGIETAARQVRYEFFRNVVETRRCGKIATAHTLDDQAETVLLKFARGAGTRGLAGIWPKMSTQHSALSIRPEDPLGGLDDPLGRQTTTDQTLITDDDSPPAPGGRSGQKGTTTDDRTSKMQCIIRPLLSSRREALRSYLADIGQTWREDSSNRDLRHTRNRIRHGILPRLERHVNQNVVETLAETAEIARAEEDYWTEELKACLPQVWRGDSLDSLRLARLPLALRRRVVRAAAESLDLTLEFRHVEEILAEASGKISLPHGWIATRDSKGIKFRQELTDFVEYEYVLSVPGKVEIAETGAAFEAVLLNDADAPQNLLEPSFAQRQLVLRNWHAGERFWPAHTKGPKKIKELLQDKHITGAEKHSWPVIASGGEIVWVLGFGVRRDFLAKNGTGILIRETKPDPIE